MWESGPHKSSLPLTGKSQNSTRRRKEEKPNLHAFEVDDERDDDSLVALLEVNNVIVKWQLGMSSGDTIKMEFDTGSAISTLPVQKYKDIFPNRPLIDTTAINLLKGEYKTGRKTTCSRGTQQLCVVKTHNACIVWKWLALRNKTRLESDLSYFRERETSTKYPWSVSSWSAHSSQQKETSRWREAVNQSFAALAGPLCHETESWGQGEMPRRRRNITQGQIQQLVDTYCTCRQTKW